LLIEQAWGTDYEGSEQTLNTHINRIRERLRKHGASLEIMTIRGIGYRLEELK
jgi:two-component system, OmpR family, response regulator